MTSATYSIDSLLELLLSVPPHMEAALLKSIAEELTEQEQEELLSRLPLWRPQAGPQTEAFHCEADILFFGGQAGGGKTDLALGLAGTAHFDSIIFRRTYKQLDSIIKRSKKLYAQVAEENEVVADYNKSEHVWTFRDGRTVELRQVEHEDDKDDYQGQPHDLIVFDEGPQFPESVVRFIIGWLRSTRPGQRCRVVLTGNPPTDSDGEWVVRFFAPWLDESHHNPAKPGELRWFATENGKEIEVAKDWRGIDEEGQPIVPLSRTFIPAKLSDNKFQSQTYRAQLQALPEPLRSQMLFGDFKAGREDNAWQIIPTKWVEAAFNRWRERPRPTIPMDAMGVDVARGGKDKTTIACRYGNWLDELKRYPGSSTPDGQAVAGLVLSARKDKARVQIDVIGVGSSPYDMLRDAIGHLAIPLNGAEGSDARDAANTLGFANFRAEAWWKMREALDPATGQDLALPPDPELKADLCAPRWKLTPRGIQVEAKEDVIKRIGRSPDVGDAAVNAVVIKHIAGAGLLDFAREEMARMRAAKAARG